ncbi:hypothetical protein NFI96_024921 [Prochilodus magdalenae]|nr:hypothetical protein NFI96_024921 [Prochilodus magdalenae]
MPLKSLTLQALLLMDLLLICHFMCALTQTTCLLFYCVERKISEDKAMLRVMTQTCVDRSAPWRATPLLLITSRLKKDLMWKAFNSILHLKRQCSLPPLWIGTLTRSNTASDASSKPCEVRPQAAKLSGQAVQNWNFLRLLPLIIGDE